MRFQLNFTAPLEISTVPGHPDKLITTFTSDETYQYMLFNEKLLSNDSMTHITTLTTQMPINGAATMLAATSEAGKILIIAMFCAGFMVQFFGSEALSYMSLLVKTF